MWHYSLIFWELVTNNKTRLNEAFYQFIGSRLRFSPQYIPCKRPQLSNYQKWITPLFGGGGSQVASRHLVSYNLHNFTVRIFWGLRQTS